MLGCSSIFCNLFSSTGIHPSLAEATMKIKPDSNIHQSADISEQRKFVPRLTLSSFSFSESLIFNSAEYVVFGAVLGLLKPPSITVSEAKLSSPVLLSVWIVHHPSTSCLQIKSRSVKSLSTFRGVFSREKTNIANSAYKLNYNVLLTSK